MILILFMFIIVSLSKNGHLFKVPYTAMVIIVLICFIHVCIFSIFLQGIYPCRLHTSKQTNKTLLQESNEDQNLTKDAKHVSCTL